MGDGPKTETETTMHLEGTAEAQEPQADEAQEPQFEAITTQEALDQIIEKRLVRERRKFADYDQLKERAGQGDELARQLAEAKERIDGYEKAAEHAEWVRAVSTETGVPAELLRGSTLEEIKAHGDSLKEYVKRSGMPVLPYQGSTPESGTTVEQDFVRKLFAR